MQIQLSDEAVRLALVQSEAAGFGVNISDYVEQLIVCDHAATVGTIPSPRNEEELAQMIQEGIDSDDAPLPWDEHMAMLKAKIRAIALREKQ